MCYDSDPGESSCRNFNTAVSSNVEQRANRDDIMKNNLSHSRVEGVEEDADWSKDLSTTPLKRRRRMHFDSILEANSDEDSFYDDCTNDGENNDEAHSSLSGDHGFLVDEKQDSSEDDSCNDKHIQADDNLFWDGGSSLFHTNNSSLSGWERDMIRNMKEIIKYLHSWVCHCFDIINIISSLFYFITEPKFMWREAYHPDLASRRKLDSLSTQ